MTIKAGTFTPHVLLSAPRRSAGVPNLDATHVLYTQSTYSFEKHEKHNELRCLEIKSKESQLITDDEDVSEPVWLEGEDDTFVCLKSGKKGTTDIVVCKLGGVDTWKDSHVAGHIEAPVGNLKIAPLAKGKYAVVLSAKARPDGSLFNPETASKTQSTGRLYKSLMVRHWDHYIDREKNTLWYGTLKSDNNGKFTLGKLVNALKGTKLECPISPFGGTDNFDVSPTGIIFVSKDPDLDPALNTKCNAYIIDLETFEESKPPLPDPYTLPGFEGASTSPVFSPDGKKAAFLTMRTNGYEAAQNEIILILLDEQSRRAKRLHAETLPKNWDRSMQSLAFSRDGNMLYGPAEDGGHACVFAFPAGVDYDGPVPINLTSHGYCSDVKPLADGNVFISASSLVDNSLYAIVNHGTSGKSADEHVFAHSASKDGSSFGLKRSQVSSIRFPASDPSINSEVHAWVVKPSNFDPNKKYPLAMLIHGGPQGSWADSWSTRWNPAVFAEQGYIVVAPNITGSTGYGQAFTDAIRGDWGGAPYNDAVNCFEYISKSMPEVDISRAVALGASYGGFMMNWINGHDLGRKFKALVCHDGVFSTTAQLSTDELYFPFHDLGGAPWKSSSASHPNAAAASKLFGASDLEKWSKNDPTQHLSNWDTPALIIHNLSLIHI